MSKITTKIKFISVLVAISMTTVIATTILINSKDKKDAYIINIAGKQRMLTQKISKEILMLNSYEQISYLKLLSDATEFDNVLINLINGNESLGIYPPPTNLIKRKLETTKEKWSQFYENIERFVQLKDDDKNGNTKLLETKERLDFIRENNEYLLSSMDEIVALYTSESEKRRSFLEIFQYTSGVLILFLMIYIVAVTRGIEDHFNEFLQKSKKLADGDFDHEEDGVKFSLKWNDTAISRWN